MLEVINNRDMKLGDVVRLNLASHPKHPDHGKNPPQGAFMDMIVTRFENVYIILTRPHCSMNGNQLTIGLEEVLEYKDTVNKWLLVRKAL